MSGHREPVSVTVDMVRCAGHGICAWLFPAEIRLDQWGFPHVQGQPISDKRQQRRAMRAARACPQRALRVNPVPATATRPTVSS